MLPRAIVPLSTGARIHKAGDFVGGAIDIYALPGSGVYAPGDGIVVAAMPSPAVPGSWQIQGYMERRDGMRVPFVLAHFIEGTHLRAGTAFAKGALLGRIKRWDQHPGSTHVHVAFRRAGDTRLPPPGNVLVERAFERFGRMVNV